MFNKLTWFHIAVWSLSKCYKNVWLHWKLSSNQRKTNCFPAKFAREALTKLAVLTNCFSAKLVSKIPAKSAVFSVNLSLKIPRNLIFFSTTYQKPWIKQRYVRKGNNSKNPAILGFFFIVKRTDRTQLNAAHAQLFEKLRLITFAETCQFLMIQLLDFHEIWQKNSSGTMWTIYHKKSDFCHSGIFNNTEYDLRRVMKIAYVQIFKTESARRWSNKWTKT